MIMMSLAFLRNRMMSRPLAATPTPAMLRRHFSINGLFSPIHTTKEVAAEAEAAPSAATTPTTTTAYQNPVRGTILDHSIDLRSVRPGDKLDIPYQITVSDTMQDFWFSSFFDQNRIHTSRPFCRQMGLQDRVVPFSLALFLTSSMSHADAAKVQVGFGKVSYLWPIFSGTYNNYLINCF
jgi:acyl dehydratase